MKTYSDIIQSTFPNDYEKFESEYLSTLIPLTQDKVNQLLSDLYINDIKKSNSYYHHYTNQKNTFKNNVIDFIITQGMDLNDIKLNNTEQVNLLQFFFDEPENTSDIIKHLIIRGYNINTQNDNGEVLLGRTLICKDEDSTNLALFLLDNGADPFISDIWNDFPLKTSIEKKQTHIFKMICEKYPERIKYFSPEQNQKIALGLLYHKDIEWYKTVIEALPGFDINSFLKSDRMPIKNNNLLMSCISNKSFDICHYLLSKGADPSLEKPFLGESSLQKCFTGLITDNMPDEYLKQYELLALALIEKGADLYLPLDKRDDEKPIDYLSKTDQEKYIAAYTEYEKNILAQQIAIPVKTKIITRI